MRISERLLAALDADKEYSGDDYEDHRSWFPNVMKLYDELKRIEDNPTMINYDRWGLERPPGIHTLGNHIDLNID